LAESREKTSEKPLESVRPEKIKTSDPRDHLVELDALRGIAILAVVLTHLTAPWMYGVQALLPIPLLGGNVLGLFLSTGWGVSLFFLLSGYLLTWTEEKRARRGAYSVRSYAVRRALRLVPAYYVAILVVVLTWTWQDTSVMDVLMHMSFLHTLNPYTSITLDPAFWSLTPEVIFYLLLPFLILKLPRLSQRLTLFGVLFFVSLASQVYMAQHVDLLVQPIVTGQIGEFNPAWYLRLLPTTYLYLFLAGVLLRMVVERLEARPTPRLQPHFALVLFSLSALFLVILPLLAPHLVIFPYLDPQTGLFKHGELWAQILVAVLNNVMLIAFFASALLGAPLLRKVLSWRPLAFIGMISYSMFLLHQTIILVLFRPFLVRVRAWIAGAGDLVAWAAFLGYSFGVLAAAVAVSYLSYRYIESPFLRYKPK
jgi:peptidoglycan/LPS O-acetylase OafA/YrhL